MAKNPSLTIDVNAQKFKDFAKSFSELTAKMQGMTQKWKELGDSINKSTSHIDRVTKSIQTAGKHLADFSGTTTKITKSIAKWGGMIGGIVTMLGGGAFLGMDRIAQRMVDTRRRLLGLGGADYGRTQAVETFGKGLLDDPKGALSRVAKGKYGSLEERVALLSAGISEQDIRKKKPEDLLIDFMKRLSKNRDESDTALLTAKGRKETSILSEEDVIRLHGKEGGNLVDTLEKRFKAAGGLKDEDLKAWDKFWESVTNFKTKIDTEWIKALEPLAPAGSKLIEVLTNMTTKFAELITSMGFIQTIANGIEWLAKFLEEPSWKLAWEGLYAILKKLLTMWSYTFGLPGTIAGAVAGSAASAIGGAAQDIWHRGFGTSAAPSSAAPSAAPKSWMDSIFGNWNKKPGTTAPSTGGGGGFGRGGGFSLPGAMPAPFQFSSPPAVGGGGGGAPLPGSTPPPFKFASAARAMSPSKGGTSIASISSMMNDIHQNIMKGGGGGNGQAGPLNVDNWQSTRTASLVVRNVPGSNVFLSAAGMTG
jgi:hypothetical protein